MKKSIIVISLSLSAIACAEESSTSAPAIESKAIAQTTNTPPHHQGESLHEQKCTSCHRDEVYTREDKMVKTMSALENQVNNCMRGAARAEWTQAETNSVIDFLNDRYYKF